jgi:hypothetical protein
MARSIVTSLVGIVTLASCGTASVSGHPCESPSTRQAWEDCRPPTASEVLGAELLIAALETPISRAAAEYVIASTEPGLTASVAYFVVPSDGPETAGRMGLESGLDGVVAAVAEAFSEDGRTGADRLLIHAIGFVPGAEERGIDEALEVLADAGFEMYLCTTPGFRGGCGVPSP